MKRYLPLMLLAGCGYGLVGSQNNLLPATVKTIAVPAFVNKTTRVELEQRVTQAVADEFVSRGRLRPGDAGHSGDRGPLRRVAGQQPARGILKSKDVRRLGR